MPALVCADLEATRGDALEVRPVEGRIINHTSGREFACEKIPTELMEIVAGGGLMPWLERKLAAERRA
ncbi:3-isopropylmalate dehydratase small subunit [compost metagenome]